MDELPEELPSRLAEFQQALSAERGDLAAAMQCGEHVFAVLRQATHFARMIGAIVLALFTADVDVDALLTNEQRGGSAEMARRR